jgi:hypothetical protein
MLKITDLPSDAEPDRTIDTADRPDGDGPRWPDLPNGRILIEIVDGQDTSAPTVPAEDDWAGPDWTCGASLSDFIRHLSPDIWQRLQSTIDSPFAHTRDDEQIQCDETGEDLGVLSELLLNYLKTLRDRWSDLDHWERSSRIRDVVLHLVLEKTEAGQGFCLKFLRRSLNSDWAALPHVWRDKLKRLGTLGPPGAPTKCIDPVASTICYDDETFELAVFKSAPEAPPAGARSTNPNRGGRPPKYDWEGFHNEVTRVALTEGELPDRLELHRRMIEWCAKNWSEQPEGSEIRKRIARLYSTPGILP